MKPRSFRIHDRMTLQRVAGMLSKMIVSEDRPLLVEVSEKKDPKTRAQEKLFHSILGDVSEQIAVKGRKFSVDAWKEYFARRYLGTVEVVLPDGEIITRRRSTAEANVEEYNRMIDSTLGELASEYGYMAEVAA